MPRQSPFPRLSTMRLSTNGQGTLPWTPPVSRKPRVESRPCQQKNRAERQSGLPGADPSAARRKPGTSRSRKGGSAPIGQRPAPPSYHKRRRDVNAPFFCSPLAKFCETWPKDIRQSGAGYLTNGGPLPDGRRPRERLAAHNMFCKTCYSRILTLFGLDNKGF